MRLTGHYLFRIFVVAFGMFKVSLAADFYDDFDGTEIDRTKWNTDIATSGERWCTPHHPSQGAPGNWQDVSIEACGGVTQEPPYGVITLTEGWASFDAGATRAFPYIWAAPPSRPSPFPVKGDFVLEVGMKYEEITGAGSGLLALSWENSNPVGDNPPAPVNQEVFRIWAHNGTLLRDLLGERDSLSQPLASHDYRLEYMGGVYSLFVDGILAAGPASSTVRPNAVWIGNPSFYGGNWTDFTLDYIRVEALPSPGNASFSPTADLDVLDIDFGEVPLDSPVPSVPFSVTNLTDPGGASLSLETLGVSGDSHILDTDAHSVEGVGPGETIDFTAWMETSTAGKFASTTLLEFSDTRGVEQQLTLNLTGEVLHPLEAGDANQDYTFDQLDLVQIFLANKYLTGEPATWGEGDWNGAPGGSPGDPPLGDGVFDNLDVIAALQTGNYLQGPYAAIRNGGVRGDEQTSIIYDARTGEIAVDAPASTELTSINIDSAACIFGGDGGGDPALNLGGSFDNDSDCNIFKATFGSSFGSLSFGNVAPAGLSEQFVANDLIVVGSLAGGGDLGQVDLIYIPEPSTLVLLSMGAFTVTFGWWRRRRGAGRKRLRMTPIARAHANPPGGGCIWRVPQLG